MSMADVQVGVINMYDRRNMRPGRAPTAAIVGLALVTLVASACENAFEPFRTDSNLHFSLFGYLNASADTQWIRVTPVRRSVFTTPGNLDATVTLERMGSGESVVLRDSIFRFAVAGPDEAASSWAHNFWTDVPIAYGETYRFSVRSGDGTETTVLVPMPEDLQDVVVGERVAIIGSGRNSRSRTEDFVRIATGNLALVRVIHYVSDRVPVGSRGSYIDCSLPAAAPRVITIRQTANSGTATGNVRESSVSKTLQSGLVSPCVVGRREIMIAVSDSEWPTGVELSPSAPAVGDVPSAVAGGVGFVGGVVTRTVPFENCAIYPSGGTTVCELHYNAESVTVKGVVTDAVCHWPVEGATVELREPGGGPNNPVVVRTTTTDQHGYYEIGALVGGTSYGRLITHPALWPPDDPYAFIKIYPDYQDTVVFESGETATRNVVLPRAVPCE